MRYPIAKTSLKKNLILADSQLKDWIFPNFYIVSIPGARVCNALDFLPERNEYNIVLVFLGANDLFTKAREPSHAQPHSVARELDQLGQRLAALSRKTYIPGLPHRLDYPERSQAVNLLLNTLQKVKGWDYRGISEKIYSNRNPGSTISSHEPVPAREDKFLQEDELQLSQTALSGVASILKNKILHKKHCPRLTKKGTKLWSSASRPVAVLPGKVQRHLIRYYRTLLSNIPNIFFILFQRHLFRYHRNKLTCSRTKMKTTFWLIVNRFWSPPDSLPYACSAAELAYAKSALTRVLYLMFAVSWNGGGLPTPSWIWMNTSV